MERDPFKDILKNKFSNFEVKAQDDEDWDNINERLDKKRFFRFDFFRFNIYYVAFIATYGLVTTLLTINYLKNRDGVEAKEVPSKDMNIIDRSTSKEIDDEPSDLPLVKSKQPLEQSIPDYDQSLSVVRMTNRLMNINIKTIPCFSLSQKLPIKIYRSSKGIQ
jgi:hypothetical protein